MRGVRVGARVGVRGAGISLWAQHSARQCSGTPAAPPLAVALLTLALVTVALLTLALLTMALLTVPLLTLALLTLALLTVALLTVALLTLALLTLALLTMALLTLALLTMAEGAPVEAEEDPVVAALWFCFCVAQQRATKQRKLAKALASHAHSTALA